MSEYNLTSTMKVPEPIDTTPLVREHVVSFTFQFPEAVLKQASDLNSKWEKTYHQKLIGRLLAGSIKKMLSQLAAINEVFSGPLLNRKYAERSLQHNVLTFEDRLHGLIADLDDRLIQAYKYREVQFPSGSQPLILALIKAGLFQHVKPNKKMQHLPLRYKQALGLSDKLPAPYTDQEIAQQEALEQAIGCMEMLHQFVSEMKSYKIRTESLEETDDE